MVIYYGEVLANSAIELLAQIADEDTGAPTSPADYDAITAKVVDRNTGTVISNTTFRVSDCISNVWQLDNKWKADNIGYNAVFRFDGSNFPKGDTTYRVQVTLTPNEVYFDVPVFIVAWDLDCKRTY